MSSSLCTGRSPGRAGTEEGVLLLLLLLHANLWPEESHLGSGRRGRGTLCPIHHVSFSQVLLCCREEEEEFTVLPPLPSSPFLSLHLILPPPAVQSFSLLFTFPSRRWMLTPLPSYSLVHSQTYEFFIALCIQGDIGGGFYSPQGFPAPIVYFLVT